MEVTVNWVFPSFYSFLSVNPNLVHMASAHALQPLESSHSEVEFPHAPGLPEGYTAWYGLVVQLMRLSQCVCRLFVLFYLHVATQDFCPNRGG